MMLLTTHLKILLKFLTMCAPLLQVCVVGHNTLRCDCKRLSGKDITTRTLTELVLKSVVLNSKGTCPTDMMEAARMGHPHQLECRIDSMKQHFEKSPGSTWGAYGVRRLLVERSEKHVPKNQRTLAPFAHMGDEEWTKAIKATKKAKLETLAQQEAIRRAQKKMKKDFSCKHKTCNATFETKYEADQHYMDTHRFNNECNCKRNEGEHHKPWCLSLKKVYRCPIGTCGFRFATPTPLQGHFELAHPTVCETVDAVLLAKCVGERTRKGTVLSCPIKECTTIFTSCLDLDSHISNDHDTVGLPRCCSL
eukprot:m.133259 g.133259  ORF g.133259 m.133259 type:complete len:307 (-) comp14668_c0_seq2:106-1026(-)